MIAVTPETERFYRASPGCERLGRPAAALRAPACCCQPCTPRTMAAHCRARRDRPPQRALDRLIREARPATGSPTCARAGRCRTVAGRAQSRSRDDRARWRRRSGCWRRGTLDALRAHPPRGASVPRRPEPGYAARSRSLRSGPSHADTTGVSASASTRGALWRGSPIARWPIAGAAVAFLSRSRPSSRSATHQPPSRRRRSGWGCASIVRRPRLPAPTRQAARRSRGVEARFWRLMSLGLLSWALGCIPYFAFLAAGGDLEEPGRLVADRLPARLPLLVPRRCGCCASRRWRSRGAAASRASPSSSRPSPCSRRRDRDPLVHSPSGARERRPAGARSPSTCCCSPPSTTRSAART